MNKLSQTIRFAYSWILPLLVGSGLIWIGIKLSKVDSGSDLNSTSIIIRERVIDVHTYQKDSVNYIEYLGEEYLLPEDKIIPISESIQEYDGHSSKKVTTFIFFDKDEKEFVCRQETTTKSYLIEKLKKKRTYTAAISYLGSCIFWVCGIVIIVIAIFFFFRWVDDLKEIRRDKEKQMR